MTERQDPALAGRAPGERLHRVGDLLAQAVGHDDAQLRAAAAVMTAWAGVVGSKVAGHATPLRMEGTTLVVKADSGVWATKLRRLGPELVGKLREATGRDVSAIEVLGPTPGGAVGDGTSGAAGGATGGARRRQKRGRVQ